MREKAGLEVEELGAPMDVLWFRLSRRADDTDATGGMFLPGRIFVMLNRGDYWQCAYVIPKGSVEEVHRKGLPAFRAGIAQAAPLFADRVGRARGLGPGQAAHRRGRPAASAGIAAGLLCIGDAAHAMSPIGGVGINLAVQDAVAAANILAEPLRGGAVGDDVLQRCRTAASSRRASPSASRSSCRTT